MSSAVRAASSLFALLAIGALIDGANAKPPSRITHGQLADDIAFTATVSLSKPGDTIHTCGGVIIGPRHILTAGHCVDYRSTYDISVRAGIHDIRDNSNVVERLVSSVFIHPNYISYIEGQRDIQNDLAILVLRDPLPIGGYIQEIILPTHEPSLDVDYVLAGWGQNSPNAASEQYELQTLTLRLGSANKCRLFPGNVLCAVSATGSPCPGDSGSPMVYGSYLYGILSTSHCEAGKPAGLVNVYDYLEWIYRTIRTNPY